MEKITTIALIAIGAGALLCLLSYFLIGGDWTGYNSKGNEHVAKTYESGTDIKEIKIDETSNEVNIVVADTDIVTIEYFDDPEKPIYEIEEKNGKLEFERNGRNAFKLVNIDFSRKDITVTIPKDYAGKLDVEITSGSVRADDVTASDIKVDNTSGSIELYNVSSTGDISIDNTSGSIEFKNLSSGGDIKIDNTTGSIEGSIVGSQDDYSITTDVTAGSSNLPNTKGGSKKLDADTTAGSIEITFTK